MYHQPDFSELETPRLLLRELNINDEEAIREYTSDPEAMRFFTEINTSDPKEAVIWIERQLKRYEKYGMGLWALIDRQTKKYVGQCGLLVQEVDGVQELEVGYNLLTRCRGNGYATEAAQSCRNYAFKHKLAPSVISIIDVKNINSQKVAMRNGMIREKQTTYKGLDIYVYRINAPQ